MTSPPQAPDADTSHNDQLALAIRARAFELGCERVAFTDAALPPEAALFDEWLRRGMHAGMSWMKKGRDRRVNPERLLRGIKSFIVTAIPYARPGDREPAPASRLRSAEAPAGWIARYARGEDYHVVAGDRMRALEKFIEREAPGHRALYYLDTGAILERLWAAKAGIGWVGKNSLVLNRELGSYFFIGIILTTLPLPTDPQAADECGSCTLCIDACPTGAIVEPRLVDSERCLSYQTIEQRDAVPPQYIDPIGGRLFGCDDCQEVCPWNQAPAHERPVRETIFGTSSMGDSLPLVDILTMTHDSYLTRLRRSALKRATYNGLRRNAAVALGNALAGRQGMAPAARSEAMRALSAVADDAAEDPLVRDHARQSIRKIETPRGQSGQEPPRRE